MPISGSSSIGNQDSVPIGEAFTTDDELLTDDVVVGLRSDRSGKVRVAASFDAGFVLEYTPDSGTTWITLNKGVALTTDSLEVFDVPILSGDLVNFRYKGSGNVNVFRVDEVLMEG